MSFLEMKESKIYNYMIFAGGDSGIRTHASFYATKHLAGVPLNHLGISPYWWVGTDSNYRIPKESDLQSDAFNHFATYPN